MVKNFENEKKSLFWCLRVSVYLHDYFAGGVIDTLTGRQTLRLFAYLRGVPDVPKAIEALLAFVYLSEPDDLVETYTPEDRKKLSLAVALLCAPSLLLLDNPEVDLVSLRDIHKVCPCNITTSVDSSLKFLYISSLGSVFMCGAAFLSSGHNGSNYAP